MQHSGPALRRPGLASEENETMKNGLLAASRVLGRISTLALWIAGTGLVAMTIIVAA